MKKTLMIFLFMASFTLILSPFAMAQTTSTTELEALYSAYIDKFTSRCLTKVEFRKSKLLNIRREAALYCFKAHFLKRYKEELIKDMIAENIGVKEHRIHYYLNKRFFEMFRAAVAAVHHMRQEAEAM